MALDLKITIQDISKYKLDYKSICYHKQLIEDLSSRGTVQKKVHMIFFSMQLEIQTHKQIIRCWSIKKVDLGLFVFCIETS